MLRTKNPSGKVPNKLYLAMDDLADEFGIGTLRLTTRQTFQLHGILKKNLKTVMSTIIRSMGSTLGACGDLNRNVLDPAAPFVRKDYLFAQQTADNIASLLTPQSGAYYDLWVDGEKIMSAEPPELLILTGSLLASTSMLEVVWEEHTELRPLFLVLLSH
ncbi:hypothetical protein MRB53_005275 [Persea americana]|uniref:Uncharacterized protein n=1 Tax=Persea americana TaxID=3435 RepID=A0ACC2MCK7_PERAE|nr:hypothetical protein MRB53_005275 [Persea americana]